MQRGGLFFSARIWIEAGGADRSSTLRQGRKKTENSFAPFFLRGGAKQTKKIAFQRRFFREYFFASSFFVAEMVYEGGGSM